MEADNPTRQSHLANLETIVRKNSVLEDVLIKLPGLGLPDCYVGAGCVAQSVWNYLSNRDFLSGINDMDIVYFDDTDLSEDAETERSESVKSMFSQVPLKIDVKNEARVHLWYQGRFGYPIEPYRSVEEAIDTWPTTATAIGVRYSENGSIEVYAPYGLNDLFGMIVRPNKVRITEEIYRSKAGRWKSCWPSLEIVPW